MYRTHADLDRSGPAWTLTFKAAEERKPPAMDHELFAEIHGHLDQVEAALDSPGVDSASGRGADQDTPAEWKAPVALIIRSAHPKVFLAGANIAVLDTLNESTMASWVVEGHRLLDRLEALSIPVIAIVSGYALGGGLELALACDFIYSTDAGQFGQTEAGLGFVSGWGGAYRLSRRIGTPRAKELFYTGRIIGAEEAFRLGLVNAVGTAEEIHARFEETVTAMEKNNRGAVRRIKGILNVAADPDAARRAAMEEAIASQLCITDPDTKRRVAEFLKGRKK